MYVDACAIVSLIAREDSATAYAEALAGAADPWTSMLAAWEATIVLSRPDQLDCAFRNSGASRRRMARGTQHCAARIGTSARGSGARGRRRRETWRRKTRAQQSRLLPLRLRQGGRHADPDARSPSAGHRCRNAPLTHPMTRFGTRGAGSRRSCVSLRGSTRRKWSRRSQLCRGSASLDRGRCEILSLWNMRDYWTPPVASPTAAYHDVIIAYDEKRYLNNGQPSLWAFVFDKLNVVPGDRVLHLGCGMGYYTAVLAELAGPTGRGFGDRDRRAARGARSRGARAVASGHGRQRRRRQRFVLEVRRRGRQRRSDPPDAGLARLPQAGGTARLSDDDSE